MIFQVLVVEDDPERAAAIARLQLPQIALRVVPEVQLRAAVETTPPDIVYGPWYRAADDLGESALWLIKRAKERDRRTLLVTIHSWMALPRFVEVTLRGFVDQARRRNSEQTLH
jgi:hypothetical protein